MSSGAHCRSLPPAGAYVQRDAYRRPSGACWLDESKTAKLAASLRSTETADSELAKKTRNAAGYFATNVARMNYPKFCQQHLCVGSGVIEAGCKTVIAHRLKQFSMFWTVRGVHAVLTLRCCPLNGRFEDYWECRRAA